MKRGSVCGTGVFLGFAFCLEGSSFFERGADLGLFFRIALCGGECLCGGVVSGWSLGCGGGRSGGCGCFLAAAAALAAAILASFSAFIFSICSGVAEVRAFQGDS